MLLENQHFHNPNVPKRPCVGLSPLYQHTTQNLTLCILTGFYTRIKPLIFTDLSPPDIAPRQLPMMPGTAATSYVTSLDEAVEELPQI